MNDVSTKGGGTSADASSDVFGVAARSLSAAGIPTLLLRDDPETIDDLNEVDVLVPGAMLDAATARLAEDGWALLDSGLFHPCKRALIKLSGRRLLKFDLHGALIDGALIYLDENVMFAGARPHPSGFLIPSPAAWFLHVLLHVVLGKSELPGKYRARLDAMTLLLAGRPLPILPAPLARIVEEIRVAPSALLLQPAAVTKLRQAVRAHLLRQPGNLLRLLRLRLVWFIGQPLGWRRGFLVAVIGPDGAGKTTFMHSFRMLLQDLQIPSRTTYLGPWEKPYLPTSRFLMRLGVAPLDEYIDQARATGRWTKIAKAHAKRLLYYANLPFEIWARHLRFVLPHLLLRRVVIADRYAYDIEIGHHNAEVKDFSRLRRFIVSMAPRPQVSIVLDNDAVTIWERKREYPLEVIEAALERYHLLARRRGLDVIRTTRPADELTNQLLADKWRDFVRWRRDRVRFLSWPSG